MPKARYRKIASVMVDMNDLCAILKGHPIRDGHLPLDAVAVAARWSDVHSAIELSYLSEDNVSIEMTRAIPIHDGPTVLIEE